MYYVIDKKKNTLVSSALAPLSVQTSSTTTWRLRIRLVTDQSYSKFELLNTYSEVKITWLSNDIALHITLSSVESMHSGPIYSNQLLGPC